MILRKTMCHIFNVFRLIERAAAYCQGKGYGSTTIRSEVLSVAQKLESLPHLAIDIGGNVGNYSLELKRIFKNIEIHIFEPSATNHEKLKNLFANDSLVSVNPFAVSDTSGTAVLYTNELGGGLASLANRRLNHFNLEFSLTENIQTIKFEEYWTHTLKKRIIDIVKLDIEGFELAALRGFGSALRSTRVVQFEFGGCNLDTKTSFQDFFYFFRDAGFELYRITPIGLAPINIYREIDEFYSCTNFIAVNKQKELVQ